MNAPMQLCNASTTLPDRSVASLGHLFANGTEQDRFVVHRLLDHCATRTEPAPEQRDRKRKRRDENEKKRRKKKHEEEVEEEKQKKKASKRRALDDHEKGSSRSKRRKRSRSNRTTTTTSRVGPAGGVLAVEHLQQEEILSTSSAPYRPPVYLSDSLTAVTEVMATGVGGEWKMIGEDQTRQEMLEMLACLQELVELGMALAPIGYREWAYPLPHAEADTLVPASTSSWTSRCALEEGGDDDCAGSTSSQEWPSGDEMVVPITAGRHLDVPPLANWASSFLNPVLYVPRLPFSIVDSDQICPSGDDPLSVGDDLPAQ